MTSTNTATDIDFIHFFDSLPEPHLILDSQFVIIKANAAFLNLANLAPEQIMEKDLLAFYSEHSLVQNKRGVLDLLHSLNHTLCNKTIHETDVQRFDIFAQGTGVDIKFWKLVNIPLYNKYGEVANIIHKVKDVTGSETKKFEKAGLEMRLYDLFMEADIAIAIMKGPRYVIETANHAVCQIWGKDRDSIMNKPLFEALPEASNQGFEELLDNVLSTGIPFIGKELPVTLNRNNINETVYFDFVYLPVKDDDGNIIGVSVVASDVTESVKTSKELKKTREQYQLQNELLIKANSNLDKFVNIASHDLRVPLANLAPILNILKEDYCDKILNKEAITWIDHGLSQVAKMEELIRELLVTAKSESKSKQPVVLDTLVRDVISQLNPGTNIQMIIQENLPVVNFHKVSLIQVFQNLIGNAIKYMDKKAGVIGVSYKEEEDLYEFCIYDNGCGIKEAFIPKIFEMFQSATENESIESNGIGLSIVRNIIKEENGKIWVKSEDKIGSSFYFTIPMN